MCGISGVYSRSGNSERAELQVMNQCLKHRGPDDEGYFIDGPVGFAHRRLSIVDVATGDQPIENENGSVVVIFNGEIYNYPKLRSQLENAGHDFSTDTDTEVLVHLYEEHPKSFASKLDGMFAFALWDRNRRKLILARDPMGIKPLLLAYDGDRIGFASELRPLLRSRVDHGSLDTRAVSEYFSLGFIPAPRTAFTNVEKVLPGQQLIISQDGIDRRMFYDTSIESVTDSFESASDHMRDLITDSVEKRLMSDVPLGTFLSGGIDSTIITGVMSQLREGPVKTFTVGFESDTFDESDAARTVSRFHNTDHTEYTVSIDDIRDVVPTVLQQLGEPFADPSLIPTYVVSRETRNDVKVALSGDGADELFAGYNRYRGEYYSKYYRSIPKSLRSLLIEPTLDRLPTDRSTRFGEIIRKGQAFTDVNSDNISVRHFEWVQKNTDDAAGVYENCSPIESGRSVLAEEHKNAVKNLPENRQDPMSRILAVDVSHGLPNQMLQKVDLASMYNSLEVRVPFLDTAVVKYTQGLPVSYKITARERKHILKHAFTDLIPPGIASRSKQGFEMPIGEWFKNELHDDFVSSIEQQTCSLLRSQDILDLHQRHVRGRRDYEWFLWNVYVFALWHARMKEEGHIVD